MEYLEGEPLSQLPRPLEPGLLTHLLVAGLRGARGRAQRGRGAPGLEARQPLRGAARGQLAQPSLKVLDFGVAKARGPLTHPRLTAVGMVLGTPAYMAPEQWTGQPVDGRADIYALGVTAYLMATGRLPYPRGQVAELVLSATAPEARPPHLLNPRVPLGLSEAILRALARRPAERFARALDFKQALEAAMRGGADPAHAGARARARARASTPVPAPTVVHARAPART